jgi:hypothetical protein
MQILNACHNKFIPNMFYAHGFVSFIFNFNHFFIKILSNLQRCIVSFGAMFLILFYKTRMRFLRCSQGRYGKSMLWGYVKLGPVHMGRSYPG